MELYERKDGAVGVLVSKGFGAGWSTWNQDALAYDKRVVDFWIAHRNNRAFMENIRQDGSWGGVPESDAHREAREFFEGIGYKCPYFGGFSSIELHFVPRGVPWTITEHDGNEELLTSDSIEFTTF